jgi:hypothetical protein
VNECRVNGGISPTEAYRRFWTFFATYVTRACGNNNHPRRYAAMLDGSVVDTDKLTQGLCWIQNPLDAQAVMSHF